MFSQYNRHGFSKVLRYFFNVFKLIVKISYQAVLGIPFGMTIGLVKSGHGMAIVIIRFPA